MLKYKNALVCGRFSHVHKGHQKLIDSALSQAERVLVFVGSAQESGTKRNPFSADLRAHLIKKIYPESNVVVRTLADMTTEDDIRPEWGRYLLDHAISALGTKPDLMVYGNDESRGSWFAKEDSEGIDSYVFQRQDLPISATQLRQYLTLNDKENWTRHTHENIWPYYSILRGIVLNVK